MSAKDFILSVAVVGCFASVLVLVAIGIANSIGETKYPTVIDEYLGCDIVRVYDKQLGEYYYFPDCREKRLGNVAPMS